ncbi:LysR family transcriptional regulator [Rhizobium mongolense]|uniref:LysR family transcriptional regulator n=1 Tax=Rhizobium mongolense TaxID=57676 RepID=UPI0034A30A4B
MANNGPVRRHARLHACRERHSFSLAAEDLGLPRSTVTDAVKLLEGRLGVRWSARRA